MGENPGGARLDGCVCIVIPRVKDVRVQKQRGADDVRPMDEGVVILSVIVVIVPCIPWWKPG